MPTIPQTQELNATSISILNSIRKNAGLDYQSRIPVATQENLKTVGEAMLNYQPDANYFLNSLVNRIGMVLITSKMYTNPLAEFKQGTMEYGETIEEIFVNIAKGYKYDVEDAEETLFKRYIPDVQSVFHKMNFQQFYPATVQEDSLRQAFLSPSGITDLIGKIIDSMYSGANNDEFICMKQLIYDFGSKGKFYPVSIVEPVDEASAKNALTTIKAWVNNLTFLKNNYNYMGADTFTPKTDQVLIINTQFDALIDVQALAYAFNMNKADIETRKVVLDDFGGLENVVALLVDKKWFMVFDVLSKFTERYNEKGLYWNYFYHVWKIFSVSPFANAIMFTTGTQSVTSLTVTPATITLPTGSSFTLKADIVTVNYADDSIIWEIEETGIKAGTYVDSTGKVHIAKDEVLEEITVKATSVFDKTKTDTCVITIA